jgi:hypothetical protein
LAMSVHMIQFRDVPKYHSYPTTMTHYKVEGPIL